MAIPAREKARVAASLERYCELKSVEPASGRAELDFRFDGNAVTLFEMERRSCSES